MAVVQKIIMMLVKKIHLWHARARFDLNWIRILKKAKTKALKAVHTCVYVHVCVFMRLEQLYWGCEWNKVLTATAGEEVITLNVGRLGDARGLIKSLTASGFPMFSPYTHRWPMTHQPLYPHSKPLLHYLNSEASCWKVGGQLTLTRLLIIYHFILFL